ncbi:hypothetical protein GMLC_09300 [Geomonas limicola]|uniref:DUF3135 domain-containing protein n=1 Tax=Geomonas limicola TaxID=2740186 RepID=A0A6V8N4I5_9BACT|nr:DUF3135 domain-containing protein [Geomonas limicola]GFO67351.1 hypothetical protein GMLC_09300 [Geomonas limicola]
MKADSKSGLSSYTPEEMSELYKKDPQRFEELAEQALQDACIGRNPEQTLKFQQMQWNIDAQLRRAKTPLGRMHVMENIFYTRVFGENGELAHLMQECTELVRVATGTDGPPTAEPVTRREPVVVKRPVLQLVKR